MRCLHTVTLKLSSGEIKMMDEHTMKDGHTMVNDHTIEIDHTIKDVHTTRLVLVDQAAEDTDGFLSLGSSIM